MAAAGGVEAGDDEVSGEEGIGREGRRSREPGRDGAGDGAGEAADSVVRARGYELLARLLLEGVTDDLLPLVRDVPDLAARLPDPFDLDEAAAEHHRLFRLEVFPYASVFLDPAGRLGGRVSEEAVRWRGAAGLECPPQGEAADHLGHELEVLAALPETGAAGFVDGHLLWWLPTFVHALRRHASAFWREVAELTMEAVLDHRAAVRNRSQEPADVPSAGGPPPAGLSDLPDDPLDDPDAGLAEVAAFLASPPRSGLYLALGDLRALGREEDVPGGFGRRPLVLGNLLRSATELDSLPGIVRGLRSHLEGHAAALDDALAPLPDGERFAAPWLERLELAGTVLDRLDAAARSASTGPSPGPPGPA